MTKPRPDRRGLRVLGIRPSGFETVAAVNRFIEVSGPTFSLLQADTSPAPFNLWPVDDMSSRRLLATAHQHLGNGAAASDALQSTIRELRRISDPVPFSTSAGLVNGYRCGDRRPKSGIVLLPRAPPPPRISSARYQAAIKGAKIRDLSL